MLSRGERLVNKIDSQPNQVFSTPNPFPSSIISQNGETNKGHDSKQMDGT